MLRLVNAVVMDAVERTFPIALIRASVAEQVVLAVRTICGRFAIDGTLPRGTERTELIERAIVADGATELLRVAPTERESAA